MELLYTVVDGVRIEYARWPAPGPAASGAQPTLVLLHEGLGCTSLWRDFPARLRDRLSLPVVAYSRPGYGGSDPVSLPRPVTYMHDDALQWLPKILDELAIESCILCGHSDGGSIALIACSGGAANRIRAVVTMAAHAFIEDISVASIRQAGKAYREGTLRERLMRYHGERVDCAFHGWHDAWTNEAFADWNIESYLPAIEVPALVIQGEDDEYGTPDQVSRICAGITGPAQPLLLPACGHSAHRDQPDAVLNTLAEFLARHQLLRAPRDTTLREANRP